MSDESRLCVRCICIIPALPSAAGLSLTAQGLAPLRFLSRGFENQARDFLGCEISERWLAFTSMVLAPIRLAMKRSRSGLIVRSSVETA